MIVGRLEDADCPIAVIGGSGWNTAAVERFRRAADAWRVPVVTAFRRQDLFDNSSELYVGTIGLGAHPHVADALATTDLLLVVGAPLDPMSRAALSGSKATQVPLPAGELPAGNGDKRWGSWHAHFLSALDQGALASETRFLNDRLPDAIVTIGAGTFSLLPQRNWVYRTFPSQAGPQSGAMGYAIPAALAAKLAFPKRPVLAFTGDGDFLMNGQELATAVQYHSPFLIVLVNNQTYGTIRINQARRYPGRAYGVDLHNPDFAAYARAFGAHGVALEGAAGFEAAVDDALDAIALGQPALIELRVPIPAPTPEP